MKSCFFEIVSFVDYQAASDRGSATMEGTSAATSHRSAATGKITVAFQLLIHGDVINTFPILNNSKLAFIRIYLNDTVVI